MPKCWYDTASLRLVGLEKVVRPDRATHYFPALLKHHVALPLIITAPRMRLVQSTSITTLQRCLSERPGGGGGGGAGNIVTVQRPERRCSVAKLKESSKQLNYIKGV